MQPVIDFNDCPQESFDADERKIKYSLIDQASALGPFVIALVQSLWTDGVLRTADAASRLFHLAELYDPDRLEEACRRSLFYRRTDYPTVERILRQNLDRLPLNPYADINGQLSLWHSDLLD
jgi:hypothetical protein